jgi:glutamyl-Q tRNA(Asp) synthetase
MIGPLPPYIGRFAPSPSGPLHAGSLVAAMASYLDARLHGGRWLLRIEDIDETRTAADAAPAIRRALLGLGMHWDGAGIAVPSERKPLYRAASEHLSAHVYRCACTRREIVDSATRIGLPPAADGAAIYPGTCRSG